MRIQLAVIATILLLIGVSASYSQTPLQLKAYVFPKVIPDKYLFNPLADFNKMMNRKPLKGYTLAQYKRYAEDMSYAKADAFYSGEMYIGWTEMENYLNKMIQLLAGEKYKKKPLIAYPKRSADINAFCIHDGSFYINVGLIASAKNEAALAAILGHEMSHYLKSHLSSSYLAMMKATTKNKRNHNRDLVLSNLYTDRQRELQADSFGAVLAANAGYDLNQGIGNFYMLQQEENRLSNKSNPSDEMETVESEDDNKDDKGDIIFSTHPDMKRRLRIFKKLVRLYNTDSAKIFQISETTFKQLQEKAKLEVLAILKERNDYRACAEKAFTYYLFDPDNDTYVYYLLESIRRELFMNKKLAKKPFLTDDYKSESYANLDNGILGNLEILVPDTTQLINIKATKLIMSDSATKYPFVTWAGAFKYFAKIAEKRKIIESYLSIALYNNEDKVKRNKFLQLYIDAGNYPYKAFAEALKADQLNAKLADNTKELLITQDFRFLEDHSYGYHNQRIYADQTGPIYEKELQKLLAKKFPHKEMIVYNDLIKENLAKSINYKQIMISSFLASNDNEEEDGIDEDATSDKKVDTVASAGKKNDATTPIKKAKTKSKTDEDFCSKMYSDEFDELPIGLQLRRSSKDSRKVNAGNTDIFILNPDIWNLFETEKIKSLEVMRVTAFVDKTKVLGTHTSKLLCICFPMLSVAGEMYSRLLWGSPKYVFDVTYYSFSPGNAKNSNWLVEEIVHYKFSKPLFKATTYSILKSSEDASK